ncbi:carbamoyltransferase C-terminal domain-containing protein [Ascidiaceihabitans sp.]|uniref:carbamoyltransferase family protein n=1 Tax=Ascidiaceihabitans sp. TaxID=1872644 RepID=UPI003296E63F
MTTWYLGLSTTGHDPALAIVDERGTLVFAEATERYMQDKRAWSVAADHPAHLAQALKAVGADPNKDKLVVASTWQTQKVDLPPDMVDLMMPADHALWLWHVHQNAQSTMGAGVMRQGFANGQMPDIKRFEHHLCHAVAACHQTPHDDAVCLVIDGEGEAGAAAVYDMTDRQIKRRWRSWGPGSLGAFYSKLTLLAGFDWRLGEEWKLMGLAAFGTPVPALVDALCATVTVDRGRLRFADIGIVKQALAMAQTYGRGADDPIMQGADLAASAQAAYAHITDQVVEAVLPDSPANLVLTGGCALNSSYNGTIARRFNVTSVTVPSAPGDDGNAVGAALLAWMDDTKQKQIPKGTGTAYLGARPNPEAITKAQDYCKVACVTECGDRSVAKVAQLLKDGKIIGVMRGRAEFGPRALGNRSILADPSVPDMKDRINMLVKGREAYRPFAPVIPAEDASQWFDHAQPAPYMSFTLPWAAGQGEKVPAVVHEDGTGRLQTVTETDAPWMHALCRAMGETAGVPVVLNTSFNIMGKPIVHSVEDAVAMFMTSGLDALLLEDVLFEK